MKIIKYFLILVLIIVTSSCSTLKKKSDMGYLKNIDEINTGEKIDYQLQIERTLYRLKSNPTDWRLRNNLIVLYRKTGNFDEAIKYGREILHNDTKNYVALNNLAMVYYDIKNYKYAMHLLKKAIEIYDDDPSAHVNLGLIFMHRGEPVLAEDQFLKAYNLQNDLYPAIKNLAYLYYEKRYFRRGIKFLEIVAATEKTSQHRNMLAIAYRNVGKHKEAYDLYQKILRLSSNDTIAIFNSAIIEMDHLNKPGFALDNFKKIKKILKNQPDQELNARVDDYINKAISLKMIMESK